MSDYIIDILGPAHLSVADAICGMMIERGISPQQLSAAIAARNAELASELSAQAAQHKSPGAAQPMPEHTGQCPSCGGGRIRVISEDGLRILACYDCRWSGIIQEVPHGA